MTIIHSIIANKLKLRWASHYSRVTGKPVPSGLSFSVYSSFTDVPSSTWNLGNLKNDVFLSSEYLSALEQAPPDNMEFRYVVFIDHNIPVGIAYFQILELDRRLHRPVHGIWSRFHDRFASHLSLRLLVCGNVLLSGEHGFMFAESHSEQALHAIAEVAFSIRRSEKRKVSVTLVKDFYDKHEYPRHILETFGYYSFDAGPNLVIPIRSNWVSFDAYLGEMKSKYRKRATSSIKKGTMLKRKSLDLDDLIKYRNEVFALYSEVVDKAKYKLFVLSPDYFVELKRKLGDLFICEAFFHEGILVGFTTRILNNEMMEGYAHGLHYSQNKTFELYQNFMLDDIRAAIDKPFLRINTGRTSIAMKSSVVAQAEDMTCYMRFSGRLSNQLLKPLFAFIKPSNEFCRNPFEDE